MTLDPRPATKRMHPLTLAPSFPAVPSAPFSPIPPWKKKKTHKIPFNPTSTPTCVGASLEQGFNCHVCSLLSIKQSGPLNSLNHFLLELRNERLVIQVGRTKILLKK